LERFKRALVAFIRNATRRMDYLAMYPATVLKDHGNHELDLQPDHPALPALVRVPLRLGLPGATIKVKSGARVLLGFDNGDPDKPACHLWQAGTLEYLQVRTGLGLKLTLDDDRDNAYLAPVATFEDYQGNKVTADPTANAILINTNTKVLVNGGGTKVAKVGDSVTNGVITGPGSSQLEVSA
jgi:hypothetical protein